MIRTSGGNGKPVEELGVEVDPEHDHFPASREGELGVFPLHHATLVACGSATLDSFDFNIYGL